MLSTHTIDMRRELVSNATTSKHKSELGQYLTPGAIAEFMANMFAPMENQDIRLLDAGAGIGGLTAAFVLRAAGEKVKSIDCEIWELDTLLEHDLRITLKECQLKIESSGGKFNNNVIHEDFITSFYDLFSENKRSNQTHAILNPPYKKIHSSSRHRHALRALGIETTNLYSAFVALALMALDHGGQLVAITPRSFCNGTYFRPFREYIFRTASLDKIHIFESRTDAFKGDDVLQENVIFHLTKGKPQGEVKITSSIDSTFSNIKESTVPFTEVVSPSDREMIMHLELGATSEKYRHATPFIYNLEELGLSVSTGPVVDFRMREHLCDELQQGIAPLIYSHNFENGNILFPKPGKKKPSSILVNEHTEKWLMPNGNYLLVRRLSSKEEKRRIIPAVFQASKFNFTKIGFENHLNIFHFQKKGLELDVVKGLALYLGSTFADNWLRRFSGHTQVNAGDLRALRYPSLDTLKSWGVKYGETLPTQIEIDLIVEGCK